MTFWLSGIVAGLIGGVVMAAVAMTAMLMQRKPMLIPVKLMAGAVQGEAAVDGGMPTVMLGMMLHMMMSGILGLIYAWIVHAIGWRGQGVFTFIWSGIAYALIVFGVNQFVSLPIVDKVMAQRMNPMVFAMSHFFYGGVLGWLFWVFTGAGAAV